MFRRDHGGQRADTIWLTNWLEKRRIGVARPEVNAIIKAGVDRTVASWIVHLARQASRSDNIPISATTRVTGPRIGGKVVPFNERRTHAEGCRGYDFWPASALVLELRLHVVAVQQRDEVDRDLLRARRSHSPWFVHEPKHRSISSTMRDDPACSARAGPAGAG